MDASTPRRPVGIAIAVVAAAAVALALLLSGCGTGGPAPTAPPPSPPPTAAPTDRTTGPAVSPLTGLPGRTGPVLAVKIDNVRAARPHTGLGAADVVYVEQVEAGLTRFLAVYASQQPPRVGPVRSARESDVELLRQFGRPALAYSGVRSALKGFLQDAPLYAVPPERAPAAYVRDPGRPAPHNLYLSPERALAAAPDAQEVRDIGFRFGAAPSGGRPVSEHTVRYPAARYTFTWSASGEHWRVALDGTPARTTDAGPVTPSTVVVQYVTVRPSAYEDRGGSVTPYTETVGSGAALVLRDGRAYDARWSRPAADGGTSYTTPSGEPLAFAPGQVWVVLVAR
ncbi:MULTISPECIES: DUF3048 domain-containing protein [Streptomyces]|uniref:Putative lipoprotein YerB n=2 Tax=Streptomyces TaxID=1883 RepID=A0A1D8FWN3_9ACTN|nr:MULTISPECIES: DUF3048 domain-containing protein [Streptomyces]AOT57596.1 Putative lipoprotein YerB precursor [Streptomyces rubrolavendulae]KAF0649021.1 hypothetical protein K701_15705 [Streptomyces fradiae ATCC 10745 = DSM 40063]OSY50541.1 putative lipoprotein YerB precursor [Streptomyces fradiae ATCC 10745 = DSM 40063]